MRGRETLVVKFETDSTSIGAVYCAAIIDAHTGVLSRYANNHTSLPPLAEAIALLTRDNALVVSHTKFHRKVIEQFYQVPLFDDNWFDTYTAVQALLPLESHKLADWAARYKIIMMRGGANRGWSAPLQARCDAGCRVIFNLLLDLTGSDLVLA